MALGAVKFPPSAHFLLQGPGAKAVAVHTMRPLVASRLADDDKLGQYARKMVALITLHGGRARKLAQPQPSRDRLIQLLPSLRTNKTQVARATRTTPIICWCFRLN